MNEQKHRGRPPIKTPHIATTVEPETALAKQEKTELATTEPRRRVKGISEYRRLPRLGKLHSGIKKTASSGKEYPVEVPYFVCPPEVEKVYGEKPTELDIIIPVEDENVFFPQNYKSYFSNHKLFCIGDGVYAKRKEDVDSNAWTPRKCPCERLTTKPPQCKLMGCLSVILPDVSIGGVYQIDTSAKNAVININSAIDYIRDKMGQVANLVNPADLKPFLKLRRIPTETWGAQNKEGKHIMTIHYPMTIELHMTRKEIIDLKPKQHLIEAYRTGEIIGEVDEYPEDLYLEENNEPVELHKKEPKVESKVEKPIIDAESEPSTPDQADENLAEPIVEEDQVGITDQMINQIRECKTLEALDDLRENAIFMANYSTRAKEEQVEIIRERDIKMVALKKLEKERSEITEKFL